MNIKNKANSLMTEFKQFAFKGNIVDMALGVIIGGAFGKIVSSFVANVIMPMVSLVMPSGTNYSEWKLSFHRGTEMVDGVEVAKIIDIPYGLFISEVVSFFVVAIVLFLVLKKFLGFMTQMRKKLKEEEELAPVVEEPAPLPAEQVLLSEIRDLLKEQVKRE